MIGKINCGRPLERIPASVESASHLMVPSRLLVRLATAISATQLRLPDLLMIA
jgi:hypothetical protein